MEVKNKKWLKYIGQSAVVLLLMGSVVGLYTTVQKDQKQNEAKTVQTTENTKLNIAVVNEDQAVKLNGKEYNLGASYVKNIERDNSQSWSVISGMGENGQTAMDSVNEYLDTDLGIKKIHPSMKDYPSKEDPLTYYNKGCGENGSVFCHANTWAIIAECMLKRPERAYKYYHQLLPMVAQKKAGEWRYKAEPYVYASNIFGPESDKFGLANVSWLTGTAAWMYIAVTQYMLGIRAKWDGLEIDPCLPKELLPAKVTRVFRGKKYNITITKNEKIFIKDDDKNVNVVI